MTEQDAPPRVVVVGAGIGGASAAYELRRRLPGAEVLVLEAAERSGGKLHRVELEGTEVDVGAEAMLARRPEALDLARDVGLGDRLTHPGTTRSQLWTRDALRPMPPTVLGVPADLDALRASGVVSPVGVDRAARPVSDGVPEVDVAVGAFVSSQLGDEITDRLLEPLLGGVYAGHARALSLRAAAPAIAALAASGGSLVDAAAAQRSTAGPASGPVFAGLVGGVGALVPAALEASRASVRLRATVRELRRSDGGWLLTVGPTTAVEEVVADAVVLATPAPATARLLAGHVPEASAELAAVEYASMAIVSLVVRAEAIGGSPDSSGFLVPPVDGRTIKAATFSSRKWPWVAQRLGDRLVALRTSVGRAGEAGTLQRDDDELVAVAVDDLRAAVGLSDAPVDSHVQRWGGALPQYAVGHLDRVRRIEDALAAAPGLELCGAAYHGVGIPAVIATARDAAARVAGHIGTRGRREGQ